jgi:hypothetical protein
VTLGGAPDLALNFKQPVLLSEDMVFLFKQPPTERRQAGAALTYLWVLDKEPGPTVTDTQAVSFTFTTLFTSNKLSQLVIPREVFRVVPREAAVSMFKAMGHAQVHTAHHTVDTVFTSGGATTDPFTCSGQDVTRLLGRPQRTQSDGQGTTWYYRFVMRPPPGFTEPGMSVQAHFVFRKGQNRLSSAHVEFSGHHVNVKM